MSANPGPRNISHVTPEKKLTARQWAFDALLAGIVLMLGLLEVVRFENDAGVGFTREADWLHYALIALMALPLVFRRVYPIPVMVVILGSWAIDRGLDYPESPAAIGVAIAFYTIGAELDRRQSLLVGGISSALITGWTSIGVVSLESVTLAALFNTLIATLTPLLVGREIHERRLRVEELRQRAERAEQEREERARQAVLDERSRIARELHDVVAHQMTVMTIQAEGAKRIASNSDPRVVEALETISTAGHSALSEMRRTVGLLRDNSTDADTQPLPRLTDIEDLIERTQAAGVQVDVAITGQHRPLSDGSELAAYRIVQESLTNVIRHAGPDVSVNVSIAYGSDSLDVAVSDDGRGAASNGGDGGGHGLIGMRERVAVLGGEFEAGPKAGGGYLVHATIPVDS